MTQPLFHEEEFTTKTAGEVDLPDDPNQWAQSVLQELYKQVPYITEYQPHVQMSRVDAERGFGLGHVEIQSQTEAPAGAPEEQLQAAGIRSVRVPFVINAKKLSPFDLLVNDASNMVPLTESRLRQALFRPQAFDVTSRTPGDQSMIGQLYPPYRQNYGFGGGGVAVNAAGGMGKMGSAFESFLTPTAKPEKTASARLMDKIAARSRYWGDPNLLDAISGSITDAQQSGFMLEVEKSASTLFALHTHPHLPAILNKVLERTKQAGALGAPPTVAQVRVVPGGYLVKTASHASWAPKTEVMDRGQVVRLLGEKVAMEADVTGSATVADGADVVGEEDEMNLVPIGAPGMYKVVDNNQKEHIGFVVPELIDTTGDTVPLAIFTNGTVAAIQSEIFGEPAGSSGNLPSGPVGTHGCFYMVDEEGVKMTVPFEFQGSFSQGGQPKTFQGVTFDGRPVEVSAQPNIKTLIPVDETRVLVPDWWLWLPLDGVQTISLVGGDEGARVDPVDKLSHVYIKGNGEWFTLSGVPTIKLASVETKGLSLDDAMFMLSAFGVDPVYGVKKLAEAAAHGAEVSVPVKRLLDPTAEQLKVAQAETAEVMHFIGNFRQPILLKEAASFPDPTTVDTVLSLGFLNPENVTTFVSYLPDLEDAQSKLCQLLFAVRIGLKNVPQASLERAVRSLEETIEGLKIIGFRGA